MTRVHLFYFYFLGTRSATLDKMLYLQNRRYLPADSALRKDNNNFPEKRTESRNPPLKRDLEKVKAYHLAYSKAKNK